MKNNKPSTNESNTSSTDWNSVAGWYNAYLEEGTDTYQEKVIAPNLMRLLDIKKGSTVLDVACGQGYFSRLVAKQSTHIVGIDQSDILIGKANERKGENETYIVGNAESLTESTRNVFDTIFSVLSFENIKNIEALMKGAASLLAPRGKMVVVMLHPAFRIPQHSDWGFDTEHSIQYRTVETYLSEVAITIDLAPHKGVGTKKKTTTFHRSLQWYTKIFRNAGFAITTLEEWISHKKSNPGPRQNAEDKARKEIPLFLAIELKKVG